MDTNGMIGVIKIKDGLFICDELGAQVSLQNFVMKKASTDPFFPLRFETERRGGLYENRLEVYSCLKGNFYLLALCVHLCRT